MDCLDFDQCSYSCTVDYAPDTMPVVRSSMIHWHNNRPVCSDTACGYSLLSACPPADQQSMPCHVTSDWHYRGFPNMTTYLKLKPHSYNIILLSQASTFGYR